MTQRFYFEGFDQHIQLQNMGLNTGAEDDLDRYWGGGSPGRHSYVDGYLQGRAYRYFRTQFARSSRIRNPLEGPDGVWRWGYWGRRHNEGPNDTSIQQNLEEYSIWTVGRPGAYIHINMTRTGDVYVSVSPNVLDEGTVLFGGLQIGTNWAYHEIYVNWNTGEFWFRVGSAILEGNIPTNTGPWTRWAMGATGPVAILPFGLDVDHLWASKGFPVPAEAGGTVGVAVQALFDRQGSASSGFRGGLIGATSNEVFTTPWAGVIISQPSHSGRDVANAVNYYFGTSPATGLPWSSAEWGQYRAWGVCWAGNGSEPRPQRLVSLGLMRLIGSPGGPLVITTPPSVNTFFSGPWQKSNPSLSYAAHVWNHPRIENSTHLIIDGPGCMYFPPEPPEPEQLPTIGVTFAEEFRVDHRDWRNVDGRGIDYKSFFVSGFGIFGEGNKKTQSNYINVNYEEEISGGAYLQACWDYALDPNTGRWSQRQNVYKPYTGQYKHNSRRLKLRGHGKTVQLRVENDGDRPFGINGWTMNISGNTNI